MDLACFLRSSPREIDGLLEVLSEGERRRMIPSALICSVIANAHRDEDKKPDPFTFEDFMPGAKSKEQEMIEWLEALENGEEDVDLEAVEAFKAKMKATFRLN